MFQTPTVMVPVDWKIEMPSMGKEDDMFGGCRSIESSYTKVKQIGEGTYGQVRLLFWWLYLSFESSWYCNVSG